MIREQKSVIKSSMDRLSSPSQKFPRGPPFGSHYSRPDSAFDEARKIGQGFSTRPQIITQIQ
jgi:hypothetical protein